MKEKRFTLKGHGYKDHSWLVQVKGIENEYELHSDYDSHIRVGYSFDPNEGIEKYSFVDPPEGPMLSVGNKLWVNSGTEYLGVIEEIRHDKERKCFIVKTKREA